MLHALILAGGSGTRFWPLSRNSKPKQLLDLFGSGTLLRQTIDRVLTLLPAENITILTNQLQVEAVREIAPDIPPAQIIAEPVRRDTAPAVALGAALIAARDPEATMIVLPSDQLIHDSASFAATLSDAARAAESRAALVTIGIQPTWPCPSYGYIERAAEIPVEGSSTPTFEVLRFREKPDPETAAKFLAQGNFSWNAGMFVWTLPTLRSQLALHTPQLASFIDAVAAAPSPLDHALELFPGLTPISIDFALMEKADLVLNLEAAFDWDDVGSWISIAKYLPQIPADAPAPNATNADLTLIESANNIVFSAQSGKRVALLDVNDLIVVDTPDALLVANRNNADAIKKIVDQLPPELQ